MSLVTVVADDFVKVEESHLDSWRVYNGETWAHGFKTREQAIEFAKRVGGTRVAYCKKVNGEVHYERLVVVK